MAKQTKSRRPAGKSKAQPRSYSELYGNRDTRIGTAATPAAPAQRKTKIEEATPKRSSDKVDWKSEYRQVLGDVRQLLFISAGLFALMIILGFVM